MAIRTATAEWRGSSRDGSGTMHFDAYDGPYTWKSRFETAEGTNPEELIGAAHAGCFSMALASQLAKAGHAPEHIQTTARVHIDPVEGGYAITAIDLSTDVVAPGLDQATFLQLANQAKVGCPVSQALAAVPINLDARLR